MTDIAVSTIVAQNALVQNPGYMVLLGGTIALSLGLLRVLEAVITYIINRKMGNGTQSDQNHVCRVASHHVQRLDDIDDRTEKMAKYIYGPDGVVVLARDMSKQQQESTKIQLQTAEQLREVATLVQRVAKQMDDEETAQRARKGGH